MTLISEDLSENMDLHYLKVSSRPSNIIIDRAQKILQDDSAIMHDGSLEKFDSSSHKNIAVYKMKTEEQGEIYFKKYSYERNLYKFKEFVFSSEGLSQMQLCSRLLECEIPVIEPVLSAVKKESNFSYRSVFVSKGVENSRDCESILAQNRSAELSTQDYYKIVDQFGIIWARLLNNNIIHKDPGPSNFLLKNWQNSPEVVLVDLDDIFYIPLVPEVAKVHALARFKGKFLNQFYKNYINYRRVWDEVFLNKFWPAYESGYSREKFISKVDRLARKKFDWRRKRDAKKGK